MAGRRGIRAALPAWARRAMRSRDGAVYAWLRLIHPDKLMQDDGFTAPDRHPRLFDFVRDTLDQPTDLLSFGCATGDEVAALRERFPDARIVGLDIHPGHVASCRRRWPDTPGVSFAVAADTRRLPDDSQDAVFCLSVLRRGDLGAMNAASCAPMLRFTAFERHVTEFARILRPGGLLVLMHSNFRLCDSAAARAFQPVLSLPTAADPRTPLFGPDNHRLADQAYGEAVFRKL